MEKLRVLALTDVNGFMHIGALSMGVKECEVIEYGHSFNPHAFDGETVTAYIKEHRDEFDAIAVNSYYGFAPAREAMEECWGGWKILIHTTPPGPKGSNFARYEPKKDQYDLVIGGLFGNNSSLSEVEAGIEKLIQKMEAKFA